MNLFGDSDYLEKLSLISKPIPYIDYYMRGVLGLSSLSIVKVM